MNDAGRTRIAVLAIGLVAAVGYASGCLSQVSDSCESDDDCFSGEYCVAGECKVGERPGTDRDGGTSGEDGGPTDLSADAEPTTGEDAAEDISGCENCDTETDDASDASDATDPTNDTDAGSDGRSDTGGDAGSSPYRECGSERTSDLEEPRMIESSASDGNYKLAVDPETSVSAVTAPDATTDAPAHVFENEAGGYTGFVGRVDPGDTDNPKVLAGGIASAVKELYQKPDSSESYAVRYSTGNRIETHDGHPAVARGIVAIPNHDADGETIQAPKPDAARDDILAALLEGSEFEHDLSTSFPASSSSPTVFVYEVVARSLDEAIVVGAVATEADYRNDSAETGWEVDDLTGGTALAEAGASLTTDCTNRKVGKPAKLDLLLAIDGSGSMDEQHAALANFAEKLAGRFDESNVDWRVGVTSAACDDISGDSAVSSEFKNRWDEQASGGAFGLCSGDLAPGESGATNGELVEGSFTDDPDQIAARIEKLEQINREFTMTMGIAALDRAVPRETGSSTHLRPGAATLLVPVTDEMEQLWDSEFGQGSENDLSEEPSPTPQERATVSTATSPWVEFLRRDGIRGAVSGIYWPPEGDCESGFQVAHGMADVVARTGGLGGTVCQSDVANTLREISEFGIGLSSNIRLRGAPIGSTLEVKLAEDAGETDATSVARDRTDGFDFESVVNRIKFYGSFEPSPDDRLIVPYLRWEGSVTTCGDDGVCPNRMKCIDGECR